MIIQKDYRKFTKGDSVNADKLKPALRAIMFHKGVLVQGGALPTMANTKKEIEHYLDTQGIAYSEFFTKSQLLELINV
jgi:hypothetical protein